jgi:hypothetical protein
MLGTLPILAVSFSKFRLVVSLAAESSMLGILCVFIVQVEAFARVEVLTLLLGDRSKRLPGYRSEPGKRMFGLFCGRRSAEKVLYQRGHFFQVLFQCEVTCIEEMEVGFFQILRVKPCALDCKNPIILSPND